MVEINAIESDPRDLLRHAGVASQLPISCLLTINGKPLAAGIINFHFKGACLQVQTGETSVLKPGVVLDIAIGSKIIQKNIINYTSISTKSIWCCVP